jgi:hypothetical protein
MNELVKELQSIDASLFYCITIWQNRIELQGRMSSELINYCKTELKVIEFKKNVNNYLEAVTDNLKIVLT